MKFLLSDVISYDEIYQAIVNYRREKHNDASYILVHPETRHKIMISSQDAELGMSYRVVYYDLAANPEKGLTTSTSIFGLYIIVSTDVEPGFMIICG